MNAGIRYKVSRAYYTRIDIEAMIISITIMEQALDSVSMIRDNEVGLFQCFPKLKVGLFQCFLKLNIHYWTLIVSSIKASFTTSLYDSSYSHNYTY